MRQNTCFSNKIEADSKNSNVLVAVAIQGEAHKQQSNMNDECNTLWVYSDECAGLPAPGELQN